MKKEDAGSLALYILMIAVAIVYSFTVLRAHFDVSSYNSSGLIYALYIIVAILCGIISAALLLEIGHIIGAKIGKYEVISVCVLFFTFYKSDKKWKFKFKSFDGLTGETKVVPIDEKSSPKPYHLFGTILLTVWVLACFLIFAFNDGITRERGDLAYFFLTIMVVVALCLIYNIMPIKLDCKNDGYGLRMMAGGKNKEAYNNMLKSEEEVSKGKKNINVDNLDEINNYTGEIFLNKAFVLIEENQYEESIKILEKILSNKDKVSGKILNKALSLNVFSKVMSSNEEDATKYLNENISMELRRDLSDDNSFNGIRAYILIEALTDQSKSECLRAIGKVNSAYKRTNKERRESETKLYNKTIDYVNNVHPKWEFEQYKIDLK